jgi:predicted ATPase
VYSSGDSFERFTPFFAFREVMSQLFCLKELVESSGEVVAYQKVRKTLEEYNAAEYLPLLHDFFPFTIAEPEKQAPTHNKSETIRECLLQILNGYTQQQPLVLVLDDAQWLDSASWYAVFNTE